MKASAGAPGLGSAKLKGTLEQEKKIAYDEVKKEGFCIMPRQGLCSFKPNCKDTNTIYITAVYFDNEGVEHFMAENVPHAISHKAIITSIQLGTSSMPNHLMQTSSGSLNV